jgi:osmotically-inducible protein OsmY
MKVPSLLFPRTTTTSAALVLFACAVFASAIISSSAAAQESKSTAAQLSDKEISRAIESDLRTAYAFDSERIDVASANGIVTLSGRISSLAAKREALEIVSQIRGVRSIINLIVVVRDEMNDETIVDAVRKRLANEMAVESGEIKISISSGMVKLTGEVDSIGEKMLAEDAVAMVNGVLEIENEVKVDAQQSRPDDELQEEIQSLLDSTVELDDANILVSVQKGVTTLAGFVGSEYGRQIAYRKAMIIGVKKLEISALEIDPDRLDGTRRHKLMAKITDDSITDALRLAFSHDPRTLSYLARIEIESESGVVTLTGKVSRLRAKLAMGNIARNTTGVWKVSNYLKVRYDGEEPTADEMVASVQEAIKQNPYVSRHALRVHCRNAHVSLYGLVDSEFEKRAAGWTAGGQKGVVHVNNYLAVPKVWEQKPDAEIKADIEEKLKFTLQGAADKIDVTVKGGVAILRGEVDTWRQWQTVMNKSLEAGARKPHNLLKVHFHPRHGGQRIYIGE